MALYFGYKSLSSEEFDDTELKKDISALKTGLATNNTKTKSLETSVFKKDGSIQMTGDLDLGNNSIVGIHNINADNSVTSKKYITDELAKKLSRTGGLLTGTLSLQDGLIMFGGMINMANQRIRFLQTPSVDTDASTKKYVDDKTQTNATNITRLAARVVVLEAEKKIYNYFFTYGNLGTSFTSPQSKYIHPDYWMYCKGLTSTSKFHIHHLIYDSDSSIPNDYVFTFQLDFFNTSSNHVVHTLGTVTKRDKAIPGESMMFIDTRYNLSTVTNLSSLVMARLRLKGSSAKGNEITVSCSFEI